MPRARWRCQQYLQRVDCWLQCQWCWEGRRGLGRTHRCQVPSPTLCQSCFQANEESWWRRRRRRHWDTCTLATESNPLLGQCQYWSDHSILHWVAFQDSKVLNSACKEYFLWIIELLVHKKITNIWKGITVVRMTPFAFFRSIHYARVFSQNEDIWWNLPFNITLCYYSLLDNCLSVYSVTNYEKSTLVHLLKEAVSSCRSSPNPWRQPLEISQGHNSSKSLKHGQSNQVQLRATHALYVRDCP